MHSLEIALARRRNVIIFRTPYGRVQSCALKPALASLA